MSNDRKLRQRTTRLGARKPLDFTMPFKVYHSAVEMMSEGITDHGPTAEQMLSKL